MVLAPTLEDQDLASEVRETARDMALEGTVKQCLIRRLLVRGFLSQAYGLKVRKSCFHRFVPVALRLIFFLPVRYETVLLP